MHNFVRRHSVFRLVRGGSGPRYLLLELDGSVPNCSSPLVPRAFRNRRKITLVSNLSNIHWAAAHFLEVAIPLFLLFTGLAARLRQMCEYLSRRRRFWMVTLFACAYLLLAALIMLPFDFYVDYPAARRWTLRLDLAELADERRRATLCHIDRRSFVNLASLSFDRQKPAPLVALLRPAPSR
jgi:hypothetical protein